MTEKQVVTAVENYFKQIKFNNFDIKLEKTIKMGSKTFFAGITLNRNNTDAAIIECKDSRHTRDEGIKIP